MSPYAPRSERIRKEKRDRRSGNKKAWGWILQAIALAFLLAIIIRLFIFEPFNVSGPSMQETMHTGDLVLVNKLIYDLRDPKRGEVIVFHTPHQKDYIKRVIGIAGDRVEAVNNQLMINGKIVEEPYISDEIRTQDFAEVTVPSGHVFVLGDNRLNSEDSRSPTIGPVPLKQIVGRADLIYWPITDLKFLWF